MTSAHDWVDVVEIDGSAHFDADTDANRLRTRRASNGFRSPGPARRRWWHRADRRVRALAVVAVVAAAAAAVVSVAAMRAHHPVTAVTRTVASRPAPDVDALGCPVDATCAVRGAPTAAGAVSTAVLRSPSYASVPGDVTPHFANLPFDEVQATEVYDVARPSVVYARYVRGSGTFDGASLTLTVVAQCRSPRTPAGSSTQPGSSTPVSSADSDAPIAGSPAATAALGRPTASAVLGQPTATDTYFGTDGSCSVSLWCRYHGLFTAGGYAYDSPEIAALLAALGKDPRLLL